MASTETSAVACPNCRQEMQGQDLEGHAPGSAVRVDVCFSCAGIWFDHLESVQLAPGAVVGLLKQIHAHRDDARQPTASQLGCPRCRQGLALSYDMSKGGRFSYFRCPGGDGRFTPFMQFLREKQFVRNMTPAEIQQVRAEVRQILCSQCGAPIDLEHDTACKYCHSPLSFLDPDAVEKAVKMYADAEGRRRAAGTPDAIAAVLSRQAPAAGSAAPRTGVSFGGIHLDYTPGAGALDLVAAGVLAIGALLNS